MDTVWEAIRDVLENNEDFNHIEYKFKFNVCEHFDPAVEENSLVHTNIHADFQGLLDTNMDELLVQQQGMP